MGAGGRAECDAAYWWSRLLAHYLTVGICWPTGHHRSRGLTRASGLRVTLTDTSTIRCQLAVSRQICIHKSLCNNFHSGDTQQITCILHRPALLPGPCCCCFRRQGPVDRTHVPYLPPSRHLHLHAFALSVHPRALGWRIPSQH